VRRLVAVALAAPLRVALVALDSQEIALLGFEQLLEYALRPELQQQPA
jgi:hypothetical protein